MLQAQGLLVTFLPLAQLAIHYPRKRELTGDVLCDCGVSLSHTSAQCPLALWTPLQSGRASARFSAQCPDPIIHPLPHSSFLFFWSHAITKLRGLFLGISSGVLYSLPDPARYAASLSNGSEQQ